VAASRTACYYYYYTYTLVYSFSFTYILYHGHLRLHHSSTRLPSADLCGLLKQTYLQAQRPSWCPTNSVRIQRRQNTAVARHNFSDDTQSIFHKTSFTENRCNHRVNNGSTTNTISVQYGIVGFNVPLDTV